MFLCAAAVLGAVALAAGSAPSTAAPSTAAPSTATPSVASPAGGAWLDTPVLAAWNVAGARVPRAPRTEKDAFLAERCKGTLRAPDSAADRAVAAAGWRLFGALQRHGAAEVVLGLAGFDGMCRPRNYQAFVFTGGRFAGTLAPRPMESRTDGSVQIPHLTAADHVFAVFSRYRPQDPLCCPSRLTTVEYRIDAGAKGPVVVATSARTEPTEAAPQPAGGDPHAAAGGMCAPEPAATACEPGPASPAPISMRVWHLVRIQLADGSVLVPDVPSRYTLELDRDGRAQVRADCNRATGTYRLDGSSLGFGPLATTRAACPPGSLSDRYLRLLGLVASWTGRGGRILLAARADGALLELQPAPGLDGVMSGAERCARAGGSVATQACCGLVGDFPNTCLLGACGCAPDQSHDVQVCRCPAGRCFDGKSCVDASGPAGSQLR